MSADVHLADSNLLAAFAESRVSDEERRLVTEHLTSCGACRSALAALARATDEAHTVDRADAAVAQAVRPRFLSLRPVAWLPVAAVLAIATVSGIRLLRMAPPPSGSPVTQTPNPAPPQVPPALGTPSAGTNAPSPGTPQTPRVDPPGVDPGLLPTRGTEQRVGGKTFRLVAGEWIDNAYDRLASLPEVRTATPEETTTLIRRVPALEPYATVGDRVLVVVDGTIYRLRGSSQR